MPALAQENKVIKVYHNGEVIRQYNASDIDYIEVTDKVGGDTGEINGHEYVDLGLPSGLKWATCNVGAATPAEYGNYYAWGETSSKDSYSQQNSLTFGKSADDLKSEGVLNEDGILTPSHDAASARWGASWRMPSSDECKELVDQCTWTWTAVDGIDGCKVTGPNGNSIFMPAAGYRTNSLLLSSGTYGGYWGSSFYFDTDTTDFAYFISFSTIINNGNPLSGYAARYFGYPVRPVSQ